MATGSVLFTVPAIAGSIIPDLVEKKPPNKDTDPDRYRRWRQRHRKTSHWFLPYLIVAAIIFINVKTAGGSITYTAWDSSYFVACRMLFFLFVGCLLHIAQDAICGKVPSFNPRKKIGIKMFPVGSIREYAVTTVVAIMALMSLVGNF